MDPDKLALSTTTDGKPPAPGMADAGAPQPINPATGQHGAYYVLTPEERAKGFVRPVRNSYKHVGPPPPKYPLRPLTPAEHALYDQYGYVRYEAYPDEDGSVCGKFWTQAELDRVGQCGQVTSMGQAIAETYARDPSYYGSTFCCHCGKHLRVGAGGEFVWLDDGSRVGT